MKLLSISSGFFGLDIGTTSIRVVQVRGGATKALVAYGERPIPEALAQSDSNADQQKLLQEIKQLLADSHVTTNNVAVGLPSSRVFSTIVDIDRLNQNELSRAIKLQAGSLIPTPFSESKIDWALLGDSPKDAQKVEVLLSSVPNEFIEKRLDMLESIGLNVVAFEPDSFAVPRAVLSRSHSGATVIIDMGEHATDLIVTLDAAPRLVRSIPTGTSSIVSAAMQNLDIDKQQAEKFVYKFGLSKDKLEGQIYNATHSVVDTFIAEVGKSIKFFQARYEGQQVQQMIVTGGAAVLPEFPILLSTTFSVNVEIGNAWLNVAASPKVQNELMAVSHKFTVAAGLAEREQ